MADVSTWSATAASNNQTPPDGWPENMLPSQVNDTGREMMAAIRRFYDEVIAQVSGNGSFFALGVGGIGGYFIDGFQVLTSDNSDQLFFGNNTHWVSLNIGKAGGNVVINDTAGFRFGQVLVGNLPACTGPRVGQVFTVVNALSPTYGASVVGGGIEIVNVMCDGAGTWRNR